LGPEIISRTAPGHGRPSKTNPTPPGARLRALQKKPKSKNVNGVKGDHSRSAEKWKKKNLDCRTGV